MSEKGKRILTIAIAISAFAIGTTLIVVGAVVEYMLGLVAYGVAFLIIALLIAGEILYKYTRRKKNVPNNAQSIYRKCIEKGVYTLDDKASLEALKIIAETYGINDLEKAKRAFAKGKALENKKFSAELEATLAKQRREDKKQFDAQFKLADIVGKQKYTHGDISKTEHIKDKLIDTGNQEDKFKKLAFTDFAYTVTEGKNLKFTCNGWCVQRLTVLGSPAALDGSIKITVFDEADDEIGYGYYSAKGEGITDLSKVGFEQSFKVEAMCLIELRVNNDEGKSLNTEAYTFKISPFHLWYIEK